MALTRSAAESGMFDPKLARLRNKAAQKWTLAHKAYLTFYMTKILQATLQLQPKSMFNYMYTINRIKIFRIIMT